MAHTIMSSILMGLHGSRGHEHACILMDYMAHTIMSSILMGLHGSHDNEQYINGIAYLT